MKLSAVLPQFSINESRWVKCPFVRELEFEIARIGCDEFVVWARQEQRENPYFKEMSNAMGRAQAATRAGNEKLAERVLSSVDVADAISEALTGDRRKRGIAECLIRNWRGSVVEGVEYTADEGVELLSDTAPLGVSLEIESAVSDSLILSDKDSIGNALTEWLQWEAVQQDRFRDDWIEDQAKN